MKYSKQCAGCLKQFETESVDNAGICPDCGLFLSIKAMNYSKQCAGCLLQFDNDSIDAAGFCPSCRSVHMEEFRAMKARIEELETTLRLLRTVLMLAATTFDSEASRAKDNSANSDECRRAINAANKILNKPKPAL